MSRLKDALMSLLGKCTPAGTHPVGNNVDEILECLAAHFVGTEIVAPDGDGDTFAVAPSVFVNIENAINDGKFVVMKMKDGYYVLVDHGDGFVTFSKTVITATNVRVKQYAVTDTGVVKRTIKHIAYTD